MMRKLFAVALVAHLGLSPPALAQRDPLLTVTSTAFEGSKVICASACRLQDIYVTSVSAVSFLIVLDAATIPADGALTTWKECVRVPANLTTAISYQPELAEQFRVGVVAILSSTSCFTKTEVAGGGVFHARVMQQ